MVHCRHRTWKILDFRFWICGIASLYHHRYEILFQAECIFDDRYLYRFDGSKLEEGQADQHRCSLEKRLAKSDEKLMNVEHPPAMHRALSWRNHLFINQMVKFASHRLQGIAGRSNAQHRTSN
jgi:hypothetical protein